MKKEGPRGRKGMNKRKESNQIEERTQRKAKGKKADNSNQGNGKRCDRRYRK